MIVCTFKGEEGKREESELANFNETLNDSLMYDLADIGRKKECCSIITKFIE